MKNEVERRVAPAAVRIEVRAEGDELGTRMVGHAAVFGRESMDLGGFVEVIQPGAFARALEVSDPVALWNHNSDIVLGRRSSGTLRVAEDEVGLAVEIDLPRSAAAQAEAVARGDVDKMSFSFRVAKGGDRWESVDGGGMLRTIDQFEVLHDVSPVTFPAYPDTDVAMRRMELFRAAGLVPDSRLATARLAVDRSMAGILGALAGRR